MPERSDPGDGLLRARSVVAEIRSTTGLITVRVPGGAYLLTVERA
jgi:hypothetical protein